MSWTTIVVLTCDGPMGGCVSAECKAKFKGLPADNSRETWKHATAFGWRRIRNDHMTYDLCPGCYRRYMQKKSVRVRANSGSGIKKGNS